MRKKTDQAPANDVAADIGEGFEFCADLHTKLAERMRRLASVATVFARMPTPEGSREMADILRSIGTISALGDKVHTDFAGQLEVFAATEAQKPGARN